MAIQHPAEIKRWIEIANYSETFTDAETDDTWATWIAMPCVTVEQMTPRAARATLEIVAHLLSEGVSIREILEELASIPKFKRLLFGTPIRKKKEVTITVDEATELDTSLLHEELLEYSNFDIDKFIAAFNVMKHHIKGERDAKN